MSAFVRKIDDIFNHYSLFSMTSLNLIECNNFGSRFSSQKTTDNVVISVNWVKRTAFSRGFSLSYISKITFEFLFRRRKSHWFSEKYLKGKDLSELMVTLSKRYSLEWIFPKKGQFVVFVPKFKLYLIRYNGKVTYLHVD